MDTKFNKEGDNQAGTDLEAVRDRLATAEKTLDQTAAQMGVTGGSSAPNPYSGDTAREMLLVGVEAVAMVTGHPGVASTFFAAHVATESGFFTPSRGSKADQKQSLDIFMGKKPAAAAAPAQQPRKVPVDILSQRKSTAGAPARADIFGNVTLAGKSLTDHPPKGVQVSRDAANKMDSLRDEIRKSLDNVEASEKDPSMARITEDLAQGKNGTVVDIVRNNQEHFEEVFKHVSAESRPREIDPPKPAKPA